MNPFRHLMRASKPLFAAKPGSPFSLGLRGNLVAAGAGDAELEVDRVRHYPGGTWLDIDARPVALDVPEEARSGPRSSEAVRFDRSVLGVPVLAYTLKAKTTGEAILGAPNTLRIARVSAVP